MDGITQKTADLSVKPKFNLNAAEFVPSWLPQDPEPIKPVDLPKSGDHLLISNNSSSQSRKGEY
jgi:hypothetical protein